jgi:ribosomal protein L40E
MFCSKCGNQLPDDARFCNECGNSIAPASGVQSSGYVRQPQFQQTVPRAASVNFDALKTKGKSTVRKIMGDGFEAAAPEPEYEKHPHPYHSLGGWLGFITYGLLVGVALLVVLTFITFIQVAQMAKWLGALGGWLVFVQFVLFAGFGFVAFFCVKMFIMIRNKNPRFLRFYELMTLLCGVIYIFTLILSGFRNFGGTILSIVEQGVIFAIWSTYFRKSVRVRTYFGSDEYLRRSIMFKNAQAPEPADTQPYVAPQPTYTPPQNQSYEQPYQQSYAPEASASGASAQGTVFCSKCGAALAVGAMFCGSCGETRVVTDDVQPEGYTAADVQQTENPAPYTPSPQAAPMQAPYSGQLGNNLLATVSYKGNGESARFFDDHVEFEGYSVRYSDIAIMDTHASASTTYAFIFIWGSFDGWIRFTLMNGQKIKIKVYGFSFWGIGSKGSAKRRFQPLFTAAYQIAAKAMAANALAQIRQGATVNLAGIEINSNGASCKKLLKREPIYITRQNFGACGLDGYSVRIVDKNGNKLFSTSDDSPNALLLPYVLTSLFGN